MLKRVIICAALFLVIFAVGCGKNDFNSSEQTEQIESEDLKREEEKLKLSNIETNTYANVWLEILPDKSDETKITVQITNDSDGEIMTGDWYVIEVYQDGNWYRFPEQEFDSIGYPIETQQTKELVCVYQNICELDAFNQYRIIKSFTDSNGEVYYISEEFEIGFH